METTIYTSLKKAVGTLVAGLLFIAAIGMAGFWIIAMLKPVQSQPLNCESDIALQGCEDAVSALNKEIDRRDRQIDISETELERSAYRLDMCENILMLRHLPKLKN